MKILGYRRKQKIVEVGKVISVGPQEEKPWKSIEQPMGVNGRPLDDANERMPWEVDGFGGCQERRQRPAVAVGHLRNDFASRHRQLAEIAHVVPAWSTFRQYHWLNIYRARPETIQEVAVDVVPRRGNQRGLMTGHELPSWNLE